MRSSKNRSRSKGNRNRSVGNIVNRVFDSSGPEGKVRGTPQQIIDKYNQLTRDAQLSNDRVAAENFQQHAEHYLRLLSEAQREQDARRDQQGGNQNQGGGNQQRRDQNDGQGGGQDNRGQDNRGQDNRGQDNRGQDNRGQDNRGQQGGGQQGGGQPSKSNADDEGRAFDTVVPGGDGDGDSTLVETPEASKPRRSRTRRPRKSDGEGGESNGSGDDQSPKSGGDDPSREAAE